MRSLTENTNRTIIENARVVTPDAVVEGASLVIEDGWIARIVKGRHNIGTRRINANRQLLVPGFIDLHSDALEKYIEPRPGSVFPMDSAMVEFDKTLSACGVTTIFHCIAFVFQEARDRSLRTNDMADHILTKLVELRPWLRTRTKTHLRFDILNLTALPLLKAYARQGHADLLSFMDHTPGQGQYRDTDVYRRRMIKHYGWSRDRINRLIDDRRRERESLADSELFSLSQMYHEHDIPMASHDDDGPQKVAWARRLHAAISEFPVCIEAFDAAKRAGMWTVFGAPNVLRGHSQSGNMSASEIFTSGKGEILASDYAPMSMLHAVFKLSRQSNIPLHETIKWITLNPAKAVRLDHELGSIEEGKLADLVLVNSTARIPHVTMTMAGGKVTYRTNSDAIFQNRHQNLQWVDPMEHEYDGHCLSSYRRKS
ncbi:MAG: phosphonate metabolism protein PhnM [Desulfobacteraceae bacterium]